MRFNSPEEVKAAAEKWAAELYRLHIEKGHDLNPYATPGGRADFDRAFSDAPRYSWETLPEWDYRYQVGQAVARLVKASQGADHA
jgi:hypothetical protein